MSIQYANAVYYPSWRVYKDRPPSCLDTSSITHIFYAFVGVNEDGTLRALDEWADNSHEVDGEKGCLAAIAKLKSENPHIKTIVSIGGGSSSSEFPALAENEEARQTFAQQIKEFCDAYQLDGVDIDWEHPETPEAGQNYLLFLQAIRQVLPAPDYLLTSALPVGEYCLKHLDLPALLPPGEDHDGMHPTLCTSCRDGVDYVITYGFPSRKVLLGIPAYARFFGQARAPGHPFEGAGEMDYCDLPDEWITGAHVDEGVAAASFVDYDGDKGFVSFDVPSTVRIKARYAKASELGGLFYWTGAGDRAGDESLVAAGWDELQSE
ncbi:hypothetical protein NM208_g9189 [Fusarium decemcellulare]|uniref:Uncharacterized protein n=1 Tax=Fusarium decemcellulare TaxID=57161 RepID=A0ACC1S2J1_9HYPO|nr:hypothetical protein NM208_g9189 [Fusarium decemcellulare]